MHESQFPGGFPFEEALNAMPGCHVYAKDPRSNAGTFTFPDPQLFPALEGVEIV